MPARVFLDSPFPDNLPVLPACLKCNNGVSSDEQYVACLIESAVAGSTDPGRIRRTRIAKILQKKPALRARIERAMHKDGGQILFDVERSRMKMVILKLARGHIAYELSLPCREKPKFVNWTPLHLLTSEERSGFEEGHYPTMFDEVGSREMQRMFVVQLSVDSTGTEPSTMGFLMIDWVEVQEGRYEYLAFKESNQIVVKIILGGYLACEVIWNSY